VVTTPSKIIVDARGHRCPAPTLLLQRAMRRAPVGAVLILLADDPMVRIDAPHYAREAGHHLVSIDAGTEVIRVTIRKVG